MFSIIDSTLTAVMLLENVKGGTRDGHSSPRNRLDDEFSEFVKLSNGLSSGTEQAV